MQDHIVSSVLLTMKDTFLNREDFNQLLYVSGVFNGNSSQRGKISIADKTCFVKPVLPAVLKPKPLWTGKQVIIFFNYYLFIPFHTYIDEQEVWQL